MHIGIEESTMDPIFSPLGIEDAKTLTKPPTAKRVAHKEHTSGWREEWNDPTFHFKGMLEIVQSNTGVCCILNKEIKPFSAW